MRWVTLRGRNEYALWDVCMVSGNSLYGVVLDTKRGGNTVEELDQLSLKKKSHLDTTELLNRDSAIWCLTSKDDTIALAILDIADDSQRWCSVTLFKNKLRVFTAQLDERANKYVSRSACTLINDSILILSCGLRSYNLAVINLPTQQQQQASPHQTTAASSASSVAKTVECKSLYIFGGMGIYSLMWTPAGNPMPGILWVRHMGLETGRLFGFDFEKQFKNHKMVTITDNEGTPGSRSRSKTAQDLSGLSGFPARFERFERFGRFFLEKPLKPLKSCLKNRSKTAHFLRWFLNGFSSKIWAVFERYSRVEIPDSTFLTSSSRQQLPFPPPPTYSLPTTYPLNVSNIQQTPPPPPTYPPNIFGKVGAGKTSLLSAVIGKMNNQESWLQTGTIRDNILLGSSYNKAWNEKVIKACALVDDLKSLP